MRHAGLRSAPGNGSGMKILIVGERRAARMTLAGALETEGVDVRRPPEASLPEPAGDEVAQIARGLSAFEKLFADEAPDAVLLVSTSNLALAAVLVATKIRIPVAGLGAWTQDEAGLLGAEPPPDRAARRRHGRRRPGDDHRLAARAGGRLATYTYPP